MARGKRAFPEANDNRRFLPAERFWAVRYARECVAVVCRLVWGKYYAASPQTTQLAQIPVPIACFGAAPGSAGRLAPGLPTATGHA